MNFSRLFYYILLLCISNPIFALPLQAQTLIDELVQQDHYDRQELTMILGKAKYDPHIIALMNTPHEAKPWYAYRQLFITDKRIQQGIDYYKKHNSVLNEAFKRYHVSPYIIVAIIGIETNYGQYTGEYSALDALSTLAFYYKPRSHFFTAELKQLLLLFKGLPSVLLTLKSSYAGAIGIPQFMPTAYKSYAISYHANQPVDLIKNHEDAILSVAKYLQAHGFKKDALIAEPLCHQSPKCTMQFSTPLKKFTVITLHEKDESEYWLTGNNFSAIMSYNPSVHYAMAVYQLSEAIKKGCKP